MAVETLKITADDVTAIGQQHQHGTVIIGNFDGLHHGHIALIEHVKNTANCPKPHIILSFSPHPIRFFAPNKPPFQLSNDTQKATILEGLRIDALALLNFDQLCANMSAQDFLQKILQDGFQAKAIVTGDDFHFGKDRSGDVAMLQTTAQQGMFDYHMVDEQTTQNGQRITSTLIRQAIQAGQMDTAYQLLSRPYQITGTIIKGQQLGRSLNMPTANIAPHDFCQPAFGVYAVTACINGDPTNYNAVASFGTRPAVGGVEPLLEVHLFDFDADIYGKYIAVDFWHFLRAETNFDSLDALQVQMHNDCQQAKDFLRDFLPPIRKDSS